MMTFYRKELVHVFSQRKNKSNGNTRNPFSLTGKRNHLEAYTLKKSRYEDVDVKNINKVMGLHLSYITESATD